MLEMLALAGGIRQGRQGTSVRILRQLEGAAIFYTLPKAGLDASGSVQRGPN